MQALQSCSKAYQARVQQQFTIEIPTYLLYRVEIISEKQKK